MVASPVAERTIVVVDSWDTVAGQSTRTVPPALMTTVWLNGSCSSSPVAVRVTAVSSGSSV